MMPDPDAIVALLPLGVDLSERNAAELWLAHDMVGRTLTMVEVVAVLRLGLPDAAYGATYGPKTA